MYDSFVRTRKFRNTQTEHGNRPNSFAGFPHHDDDNEWAATHPRRLFKTVRVPGRGVTRGRRPRLVRLPIYRQNTDGLKSSLRSTFSSTEMCNDRLSAKYSNDRRPETLANGLRDDLPKRPKTFLVRAVENGVRPKLKFPKKKKKIAYSYVYSQHRYLSIAART